MSSDDHLRTWEQYQSAWGPITEEQRRRLLVASTADDCVYMDPSSQCTNRDELVTRIEASQQRYPGATFENDELLSHHDQALSSWTMYDGQGKRFVEGRSWARFGADGRLIEMTGFF